MVINLYEIISSDFFANICQLFSAIGTVGAVLISLGLIIFQNHIKYSIVVSNIKMLKTSLREGFYVSGYSASITNCSSEKNIYLKQGIYIITKEKKLEILLPIIELGNNFIAPKSLGPGEDFTFFISEKQINHILEISDKEKINFYFMDKINKKYKFKIERKELIKELEFIKKNNNKILAL